MQGDHGGQRLRFVGFYFVDQIDWSDQLENLEKSLCATAKLKSQKIVVSDHQGNRAFRWLTLAHPALQKLE